MSVLEMRPGYSVVIPAHNAQRFIGAAIASVQAQSYPPEQIVVVDDGSSDSTGAEARRAAVTVLRQDPARGPSAARNAGVAATMSEFVAFLDADDEWRPSHASNLISAFQQPDVVFASSPGEMFGARDEAIPSRIANGTAVDLRDTLLACNPIIQSGVMLRRSAFDAAGRYEESMRFAEDYHLWQRMASLGKYVLTSETTTRYRIHDLQVSANFRNGMVHGAWLARRHAITLRSENRREFNSPELYALLRTAWREDIKVAVWEGNRDLLNHIRSEVAETIDLLQSLDSARAFANADTNIVTLKDTLRCRANALAKPFWPDLLRWLSRNGATAKRLHSRVRGE